MLRLGAFLSIAKGIDKVVPQALAIGANTFQFFTRNPRGGAARTIGEPEIKRWLEARVNADVFEVCGHLPYTVNMATDREDLKEFSAMIVAADLHRMSAMDVEYLVLHPGSSPEARSVAIERIIRLLATALDGVDSKSTLLLETMALQGNEIGSVAEIGEIWHGLGRPPQVGVCLDSCHLFAAGYDFTQKAEVDRLLQDIEEHIGFEQVKIMHLNDSKLPSGSRRDRHENIGKGEIGEIGFANLLNNEHIRRLIWHLETPVKTYRDFAVDIARVKAIIGVA